MGWQFEFFEDSPELGIVKPCDGHELAIDDLPAELVHFWEHFDCHLGDVLHLFCEVVGVQVPHPFELTALEGSRHCADCGHYLSEVSRSREPLIAVRRDSSYLPEDQVVVSHIVEVPELSQSSEDLGHVSNQSSLLTNIGDFPQSML